MRFSCLPKYIDASRIGYSVPRSLPGVALRPPSRFSGLRLFPPSKESESYSHRLRTLFRDPFRSRPLARSTEVVRAQGSSLEVSVPFSGRKSANRLLFGSTRTPSLPGLSQAFEGLVLADLCGSVSRRCRSWGFGPPELLLRRTLPGLVARRSPLSVHPSSRRTSAAPTGAFVRSQSAFDPGVFHPTSNRCSPGLFIASTALRLPGLTISRRFFRS
jgi:hypothetical protein